MAMADMHEWTGKSGKRWQVWADGKSYINNGQYSKKTQVDRDLVDEILRLRALVDSKK